MAAKRKSTKKVVEEEVKLEETPVMEEQEAITEEVTVTEEPEIKEVEKKKAKKVEEKGPKFPVGTIVYIDKKVGADLNGFCLFSQYKKDPYTVEAYDGSQGIYTLRRRKLLVRLKEADLIQPDANAHDSLNRKQF